MRAAFDAGLEELARAGRARLVRPVLPGSRPVASGAGLCAARLRCLGLLAWRRTLGRKQSAYADVLAWIEQELAASDMRAAARRLAPVSALDDGLEGILY